MVMQPQYSTKVMIYLLASGFMAALVLVITTEDIMDIATIIDPMTAIIMAHAIIGGQEVTMDAAGVTGKIGV